jgi:hypothetical protein
LYQARSATEQIAFVQKMTDEDWAKMKADRDKGSRLAGDPPVITPPGWPIPRIPGGH